MAGDQKANGENQLKYAPRDHHGTMALNRKSQESFKPLICFQGTLAAREYIQSALPVCYDVRDSSVS